MRGLRGLGVSQCSGVTGEALGQLLPSLPACTSLALNCLHLTDDHMDMLVKVLPNTIPSGFCATFPACNSALGSLSVTCLLLLDRIVHVAWLLNLLSQLAVLRPI